ncbi:MAG TPA: GTP cyclohydrolase I [Thermodesulfovibrio thiophilus]|nr:GTP cyclohydrolase I [Thermodesulfovibrio thiophilus]
MNIKRVEEAVKVILEEIGENPEREGLVETPNRVARMYEEICSALHTPPPDLKVFTNEEEYDQMIIVKDIPFYSLCFTGDTRIRIKKTDGRSTKAIRLIKEGDIVETFNDKGEIEERKVTKVMRSKTDKIYHLHTDKGRELKTTFNHPIFVLGKGWTAAEDIEVGDKVYAIRNSKGRGNMNRNAIEEIIYGEDLGKFLGILLADGSITRNAVRLEVSKLSQAEEFVRAIKGAFGLDADIEKILKPSGFRKEEIEQYRVRVVNGHLVSIVLEMCNGVTTSLDFSLPKIVLNDYETFKGFIQGYLISDGTTYKKDGRTRYNRIFSCNKAFLEEVAEIFDTPLVEMGANGNSVEYSINIPLFINGESKRETEEERFKERFEEFRNTLPVRVDLDREVQEITKVSIEELEQEQTMYNFEVEENHTYIANDIWVHNCEHHLVTFFGKASVGYIPNGKYVGLSKIARTIDYFARKPQVQERLTEEIADYLFKGLTPQGLIVVVKARHLCMEARGIKKSGGETVTSAIKGDIDKNEFLQLLDTTK